MPKETTVDVPDISSLRQITIKEAGANHLEPGCSTRDAPRDVLSLQIGEEHRFSANKVRPHGRWSRLLGWASTGVVVVVVVVIASVVWLVSRPTPRVVQVMTVLPVSKPSGASLTAGGHVRHARIVNVVARVSGVIESLRVAEGDLVREGDVIATVERHELEQRVVEREAELKEALAHVAELRVGPRPEEVARAEAHANSLLVAAAQKEEERQRVEKLAMSEVVSMQARDQSETDSQIARHNAEAARASLSLIKAGSRSEVIAAASASVQAARARLAIARDSLAHTEVRAPLSGRVLRKFVDVGSSVSFGLPYSEGYTTLGPGSPIVSIGQIENLEAVADVNQSDLGKLSPGEAVDITTDAFPGASYRAKLWRFSSRADRNKNTVEVTVRFDDPVPTLLPHDLSVKLRFLPKQDVNQQNRGLQVQ